MEKSLKLKGNSGITLIALVITIIVLIILAGISIAMISGQDGILNKAGTAAAANQLGSAKDKCNLLATEAVQETYESVYVKQTTISSDINTTIVTKIKAKIGTDNKDEIEKILGKETGKTNSAAVSITGETIKLTYSDGTYVEGLIAEDGAITWGNITNP